MKLISAKKVMYGLVFAAAGLVCGSVAHAQAPAGAPAGANGICKDGTYSMQANKQGACRGHKEVQTWYIASTAPAAAPAPAPMPKTAAMPAPQQVPSVASRPVPTPQTAPVNSMPAPVTSTGKRLSPEAAAAQKTAAPGGGPGLVWVNTESKVYHCNGDPFYGKTKAGQYMSESAATAAGAHGARGKSCAGK